MDSDKRIGTLEEADSVAIHIIARFLSNVEQRIESGVLPTKAELILLTRLRSEFSHHLERMRALTGGYHPFWTDPPLLNKD